MNTDKSLLEAESQPSCLGDVSRSPIFGIFRYDDKGYCGYFLSEESAQKVLDEEYNSDEWYVDEMVCQDCD